MKVLFRGHYYETTGWGHAGRSYIKALSRAGIDVVARPHYLGNSLQTMDAEIVELEQKSTEGCEAIIQFVLPHYMKYDSSFGKNIGIYFAETDTLRYSSWPAHINLMDEVWLPNRDMTKDIAIKTKVKLLPCPIELTPNEETALPIPELKDMFVFYYVAEINIRKNLKALIRAFQTEFHRSEPVSLLIKTGKSGMDPTDSLQLVVNHIEEVKRQMKVYPRLQEYKPEIVITDNLTEKQMKQLHKTGNCFVMPSHGEGTCLPAFDAILAGNQVIGSNVGGLRDLFYYTKCYPGGEVGGIYEPVFGMLDTFPDIFTGQEDWFNININELRCKMRTAYHTQNLYIPIEKLEYCSYATVGQTMKEYLNG